MLTQGLGTCAYSHLSARRYFETLSFLPPLDDDAIAKQVLDVAISLSI